MTTMLGLNLTGRKVVFVGGGAVASRRLPRLLDDGALVTVVAPEVGDDVHELIRAGRVEWTARAVREDDLDGAWFVHCATADRRTDALVSAWCENRRIFCVNTSDGAHGSARLTAETRAGDIVVLQGAERTLPTALAALGLLPLAEREVRLGGIRHAVAPAVILAAAMVLVALKVVPVAIAAPSEALTTRAQTSFTTAGSGLRT